MNKERKSSSRAFRIIGILVLSLAGGYFLVLLSLLTVDRIIFLPPPVVKDDLEGAIEMECSGGEFAQLSARQDGINYAVRATSASGKRQGHQPLAANRQIS